MTKQPESLHVHLPHHVRCLRASDFAGRTLRLWRCPPQRFYLSLLRLHLPPRRLHLPPRRLCLPPRRLPLSPRRLALSRRHAPPPSPTSSLPWVTTRAAPSPTSSLPWVTTRADLVVVALPSSLAVPDVPSTTRVPLSTPRSLLHRETTRASRVARPPPTPSPRERRVNALVVVHPPPPASRCLG